MKPRLIPELDVSDLDTSLHFYQTLAGFKLEYARTEERFVMLRLDAAYIMLQEAGGPGRRFRTAELEKPFGRGVNFQIQVRDVESIYRQMIEAEADILIEIEERWYRAGDIELGNRQFVTADPDGYLLRFFSDLGARGKTDEVSEERSIDR